jgi:hypothetical protein
MKASTKSSLSALRSPRAALGMAISTILCLACGGVDETADEASQQDVTQGPDSVGSLVADFRTFFNAGDVSKADAFVARAKAVASKQTDDTLRARALEVSSETQLWLASQATDPAKAKQYRVVANGDASLFIGQVRDGKVGARLLDGPVGANPFTNDAVGKVQLGATLARSTVPKEAAEGKALLQEGLSLIDLAVDRYPEGGLLLRGVIRSASAKPGADAMAPALNDLRSLFESCLKKPLASQDKLAMTQDELRQLEQIASRSFDNAPDGLGHAADRSRTVCASTPIAPHATENQLVLVGDMLVKAGRLEEANGMYTLATKAVSFGSWPFKSLAKKRSDLIGGIVSGRVANPGFDVLAKTAALGEGACNACHQTK